jgi:hypothetical protein
VSELLKIALIIVLGFNAILLIALAVRYLAAKEEEFFSIFSESAAAPPPDTFHLTHTCSKAASGFAPTIRMFCKYASGRTPFLSLPL